MQITREVKGRRMSQASANLWKRDGWNLREKIPRVREVRQAGDNPEDNVRLMIRMCFPVSEQASAAHTEPCCAEQ